MQVLSQIFSKEAAMAYHKELEVWLNYCHTKIMVKMQKQSEVPGMTAADKKLANSNMMDWLIK